MVVTDDAKTTYFICKQLRTTKTKSNQNRMAYKNIGRSALVKSDSDRLYRFTKDAGIIDREIISNSVLRFIIFLINGFIRELGTEH